MPEACSKADDDERDEGKGAPIGLRGSSSREGRGARCAVDRREAPSWYGSYVMITLSKANPEGQLTGWPSSGAGLTRPPRLSRSICSRLVLLPSFSSAMTGRQRRKGPTAREGRLGGLMVVSFRCCPEGQRGRVPAPLMLTDVSDLSLHGEGFTRAMSHLTHIRTGVSCRYSWFGLAPLTRG
jgi:hypothetical protein